MYPAPFEYHRAGSVNEALELLGQYGEDAKLLAGGHSLIPLMKLRFAQPQHLIDVRRIPGLSGIREEGGAIAIGATTTHHEVETSALLQRRVPVLAEAASQIGDQQIRNLGTIGGSLAHADPAADLPAVMLALGAQMIATGPGGERTIAADDFFVDLLASALRANEVLTRISVPVPAAGTGGAYEKYPHPASRYALVGVAAVVTISGGKVQQARVGITGVGTKAARARGVEQALTGAAPDEKTIAAAAQRATEGIEVRGDAQGGEPYKRSLAASYAARAIARAVARAAPAR